MNGKTRFSLPAVVCAILLLICRVASAQVQWKLATQDNRDFAKPELDDSGWREASVGTKWKCPNYAWLRGKVTIPEKIQEKPTTGQIVGIRVNSGDGGECYLDGRLYCRYDNDHPAMIVLSRDAKPGQVFNVAVRVFMGPDTAEHDADLSNSELCIIDRSAIEKPFAVKVDAKKRIGPMPRSFSGFSQGGGLPDYDDATAALFRGLGIKWFRMDNVLTNAVKTNDDGTTRYDWADLDKRLDFMKKVGCEFIFCISYMPQALDAVPNGERHSYPRDWDEFGELVYQAAKHCSARGTPVKYWEVWNEINTGWMVDPPGWDHLKTYLTLYDTCWKAVKKADPKAWIGGPCVASGPWNDKDPRGPGANGEKFMRGLFEHCQKTGAPLDFVTWHEYFQNYSTMRKEADQIRAYLKEYPKVKAQVKEFAITEWSYAWWHDRAHDNEVGAAWAAASMLRGWMAAGVQKPCWFLAKDFSSGLSGEWGLFTRENKPKAVANVCRMFNMMGSERVKCDGEDDQIASVSAIDPKTGKVTVLILNFGDRWGLPRNVKLTISGIPKTARAATCRRYLVDVAHSNLVTDESHCELETVPATAAYSSGSATLEFEMANNAVTLVEF